MNGKKVQTTKKDLVIKADNKKYNRTVIFHSSIFFGVKL
jgi:hypothetical protein